jgi:hypothetical protein
VPSFILRVFVHFGNSFQCRKVLEPVNLTKQLKLSDLEAIFWSIQTAIATDSDNPVEKLQEYIFPEIPETKGIYDRVVSRYFEEKSVCFHFLLLFFLAERYN